MNDTQLYAVLQSVKDALTSLAGLGRGRNFGFLSDELYHFRQWYLTPEATVCQPEDGGPEKRVSPCEALMLFREEKLSGKKYYYDFSGAMPEEPDEYVLDLIAEMSGQYEGDTDDPNELDMLPDEYDPAFSGAGVDPVPTPPSILTATVSWTATTPSSKEKDTISIRSDTGFPLSA